MSNQKFLESTKLSPFPDAKGVEGRREWEGCPLPSRLAGLWTLVSSPSGVWDRAAAENGFGTFLALKNTHDGDKLKLKTP